MKIRFYALIAFGLLCAQSVAFACTCVSPGTVLERRLRAEKTVYGTVIQKDSINPSLDFSLTFRMKVIADYSRGGPSNADTAWFFTASSSASCGVGHDIGDTVVVFGNFRSVTGQDTLYATYLCNGNIENPSEAVLGELAAALPNRKPGSWKRHRNRPGLDCRDGWVSGDGRRMDGKRAP